MLVGRAQKAFAYLVYILINSVAASTDYGQLVCPLNVTELSNANSHSVSLLNEFRGVCIYRRDTRRSFIEYERCAVPSKTRVSVWRSLAWKPASTTNDLHLLFNRRWKNWRVKSLRITRARESIVIGYIYSSNWSYILRSPRRNAGRDASSGEKEKERVRIVHIYIYVCIYIVLSGKKSTSHNRLFLPPLKSHVRHAFIGACKQQDHGYLSSI